MNLTDRTVSALLRTAGSLFIILFIAGYTPAQTWIKLATTGTPPVRVPAPVNYDAVNNRLIVFFPANSPFTPGNGIEIWILTNANGLGGTSQWIKLLPTGAPPSSNILESVVYDVATNRLIVYGGCFANCAPPISSVFVLTNANGLGGTPVWTQSTVTNPQTRADHSSVYDAVNNLMITFGGQQAFFGTDQNDTRTLSNANGAASPSTWTTLSPLGGPPPIRSTHRAIYDQVNNRMTIFAGTNLINTCCPYVISDYNDSWVLSNANGVSGSPTWTQLSPMGILPSVRSYHSAVYDAANNRMLVFGGRKWNQAAQTTTILGDLWQLSHANGLGGPPVWTELSQACLAPDPRFAHTAAFDAANQRMILFGGSDINDILNNQVWVLALPNMADTSAVVTNTNDSGLGSLRAALNYANSNPGRTIVFNIPTSDPGFNGGVFTIKPIFELPPFSNTIIDGRTQTAFTGDTNPFGPEIVLNGSMQSSGSGLRLDDGNIITGMVINGFPSLGVHMSWTFASGGVSNNNEICGNYIGTDATGTLAVANQLGGVGINGFASPSQQASNNVIHNNLISGNGSDGIGLCDAAQTQIIGNLIGTDRTGTASLGNGSNGVGFFCAGAPRNRVENNTIAFNTGDGVYDSPDYRFSVAFTADGHQGNAFRHNSIFANGGLGINIFAPPFNSEAPNTPTLNDNCDSDNGGNLLQNFPIITQVTNDGTSTTISGTLNSTANQTFEVELFSNDAADPSGYGEGQTYLGMATVTTDANCNGSFSLVVSSVIPTSKFITATATDSAGNTSEFSQTFAVACPTVAGISPVSGPENSTVVITGANFLGVTAVKFSNNLSAVFTINSATQITATVPAGAVTGPIAISRPGCGDVLTAVFAVGPCINVSISDALTVPIGGSVVIPVMVSDLSGRGILSYDFTLMFNPAMVQLQNPPIDAAGTLSSGMSITPNTSVPGKLTIAAFSTNPLSGAGTLLNLKFNVIGAISDCSALVWQGFVFNEGVPCATLVNGQACVIGASISGTVSYCIAPTKKVPGVIVQTNGAPPVSGTSDNSGNYSLTGLNGGAVTVTPMKSGDVNGISSFDASLVAQRVAGLIAFDSCQEGAGDVSGNGSLSSFDAALIAQFAVGINTPGNTAGSWKFAPPNRAYASVAGNLTEQNYDALLMGDVSGNWNAPGILRLGPLAQVPVSLPNTSGMTGASVIVPVTVGTLTGQGFTSYDFDLIFDQNVLQLQNPPVDAADTLSSGLVITPNPMAGRLRVSGFGVTPLTGSGALLKLKFNVVGTPGTTTTLTWQSFMFNEDSQSQLTNGNFNVPSACGTISLSPASLPGGALGAAYSQMLVASGGAAPYNFSLDTGALPDNVVLSSAGLLSGTLTQAGTFGFTVKATDQNGCMGTQRYTVIISDNRLLFYPLSRPVRLLETRVGFTGCDAPGVAITGNSSRTQTVAGRTCDGILIPANAKAVTGHITTVQSGGGFLTLYPSDAAQPVVASTNYDPNEIVNNVFTVGLGASDGAFKIFASSTTDVVVDVTGYYAPPVTGGLYFHPLSTPIRLLETRAGFTGCNAPGTPLVGGVDFTQQAQGGCQGVTIPASARAIIGNATTVGPQAGGFLTMFPGDADKPLAASSNFAAGQVVNGPFTVGLGADGTFKVFPSATTDLVVDVLGYYSPEANDVNGAGLFLNPLSKPVRLLETRAGFGGCFTPGAPLIGGQEATQTARGVCQGETIPGNALGVIGNATVVNNGAGFLTLWPANVAKPLIATSNFAAGQIVNRHFAVGLGTVDGAFKIFPSATTDLVVDLTGYFAP